MSKRGDAIDKPGVALQNLVAALERALANQDNVSIESPGYLRDKDTGQKREHDVLIIWKQAHHSIIGAIEGRDRSRKIGVNEVEGFARMCERTGVDVAMMVSSKGFYKTARTKAKSFDVRCMELNDAEKFDWMGIDFFVEFRRDFAPIDVNAFFTLSAPTVPFTLYDTNGTEMTSNHFLGIVEQAITLPDNLDEIAGQELPINIEANTLNWTGAGSDGLRHAVSHLHLRTALTVVRSVKPVTLHSYSTDDVTYDVATSPVQVGDKKGDLVLVKAADGTVRVVLKINE